MSVHMCIYMYIYVYTYIYTFTYTLYIHTYDTIYVYIYVSVYLYLCLSVCVSFVLCRSVFSLLVSLSVYLWLCLPLSLSLHLHLTGALMRRTSSPYCKCVVNSNARHNSSSVALRRGGSGTGCFVCLAYAQRPSFLHRRLIRRQL